MHIGCGSTAYSVGTVYRGTGRLYTSNVCPALLATPCLTSLATPRCPGRPNYPDHPNHLNRLNRPNYPDRPINSAQLATPS
jgi:hypothetical protein